MGLSIPLRRRKWVNYLCTECSKRWYDALDPSIDHSPWTPEEVFYSDHPRSKKQG